jgi:hypothetical protein
MNIVLTTTSKYFLHQVDRWPDTGRYGEGDYIYLMEQHFPVKSYNYEKKILRLEHFSIFLSNVEQDHELFLQVVGKPWDEEYKAKWAADDDYLDYSPGYYVTLDDFRDNKMTSYNPEIAQLSCVDD